MCAKPVIPGFVWGSAVTNSLELNPVSTSGILTIAFETNEFGNLKSSIGLLSYTKTGGACIKKKIPISSGQ